MRVTGGWAPLSLPVLGIGRGRAAAAEARLSLKRLVDGYDQSPRAAYRSLAAWDPLLMRIARALAAIGATLAARGRRSPSRSPGRTSHDGAVPSSMSG